MLKYLDELDIYRQYWFGTITPYGKHIECFENMTRKLKGYIHNCTISFLDLYEKVKRNIPDLRPTTKKLDS